MFESIIMKWVDDAIEGEIGAKQFGGISGTLTTDVLVEVVHLCQRRQINWIHVRVVMLDFSKAFELINYHLLLEKLEIILVYILKPKLYLIYIKLYNLHLHVLINVLYLLYNASIRHAGISAIEKLYYYYYYYHVCPHVF